MLILRSLEPKIIGEGHIDANLLLRDRGKVIFIIVDDEVIICVGSYFMSLKRNFSREIRFWASVSFLSAVSTFSLETLLPSASTKRCDIYLHSRHRPRAQLDEVQRSNKVCDFVQDTDQGNAGLLEYLFLMPGLSAQFQ